MSDLVVEPEWLAGHLGELGLKVVDASWYLPAQRRDAKAEFLAAHIPGAVFFDIDQVADHATTLPHMLPSERDFADAAGGLGLSERDTIVVYDGVGLFTAPRVWWTLKVFGAKTVRVLNGGFPAWKRAGYPVEAGEARLPPARFAARLDRSSVADFDSVKAALREAKPAVVDARSVARFRGEAPEPRPSLASGHMPGALNLPYDELSDSEGRIRTPDEIRELFHDSGVDLSAPVITSCGSGVTAAVLLFALATLGKTDVRLYDGSWSEWGSRPDAAVATG